MRCAYLVFKGMPVSRPIVSESKHIPILSQGPACSFAVLIQVHTSKNMLSVHICFPVFPQKWNIAGGAALPRIKALYVQSLIYCSHSTMMHTVCYKAASWFLLSSITMNLVLPAQSFMVQRSSGFLHVSLFEELTLTFDATLKNILSLVSNDGEGQRPSLQNTLAPLDHSWSYLLVIKTFLMQS